MADLLLYGSNGYTGNLIARRARAEGLDPTLAGRRAEPIEAQATELGLDHRVFSLAHQRVVEREVAAADAVLNCAGPFTDTVEPLLSACLETGTDYLDVAGAVDVLEWIAARDAEASANGVTVLPAVGFDVVATDCLAAGLHEADLDATRLTLALDGLGTFSPGTLKSIVEQATTPGAVRRDGRLHRVPAAWKTREFDFGRGPKPAVTVPWGDVSTAYYTTGIPNIETYATVPRYAANAFEWFRPLVPLAGSRPVQALVKRAIDLTVSGPTAAERAESETHVWGEVVDESGERVAARLRTPDTYDLTASTAVEAARRTLDGEVGDGFQTPASAFGADFVLEFAGVHREDVSRGRPVPA